MAKTTHSERAKIAWKHADDWNISEVQADLPRAVDVGPLSTKTALKIRIWTGQGKDKERVGTLHIGKGGIQWSSQNAKPRRLNWRQFADKMTS